MFESLPYRTDIPPLTDDGGLLALKDGANGRKADRPDVGVEDRGPVNLDNGDVVLVRRCDVALVNAYLDNLEVKSTRLIRKAKVVLAKSDHQLARLLPKAIGRKNNVAFKLISFLDTVYEFLTFWIFIIIFKYIGVLK